MAKSLDMLRKDQFAELLSEGAEIPAICRRMGLTPGEAEGLFQRIKHDLGPQAYG